MKNILIVGASSGIGKTLAHLLTAEGCTVYGTYRNTVPEADIPGLHYQFFDATEPDAGIELPETLHGLVYCPGEILLKPFARMDANALELSFRVQVVSAIKTIQAALPALRQSGNASVLLFSSVAVQTGMAFHSQVSACKGAIEGLCRSLAAELAPTVRVNCIAPSLTDTPLAAGLLNTEEKRMAAAKRHPLQRIGQAADIAETARFLLSDAASWISGQIMHVDGGMSALK